MWLYFWLFLLALRLRRRGRRGIADQDEVLGIAAKYGMEIAA